MNKEHPTEIDDVFYIHNLEHRNKNPNKAQWSISKPEERECFILAAKLKYKEKICELDATCWGIHLNANKVGILGQSMARSSRPKRDLFIAKFVDGSADGKWHGYPADHEMNAQDIPPHCILNHWLRSNYFSPAKIRKISRGQRCRP